MQLITAPPHFISPEDHAQVTSSTPTSFADIPPVLRFHEEDVELELEPALLGVGEGKLKGTLWVTEAALSFLPSSSSSGFTLLYPSLTLHAISPALDSSPAFLYCQIDDPTAVPQPATNGNGDAEHEEDVEDEGGEDEDTPMREMKIFVKDAASLDSLFNALSLCASLFPSLSADPSEQPNFFGIPNDDEDEDEDGTFDDAPEDGDVEGQGGRVRADFQTQDARFRPY